MGLEILRLRRLVHRNALAPDHAGAVTAILGQLARLLMMRGPHAKPLHDLIASLRDLSSSSASDESAAVHLQAAASLRVIAAVLEDHPIFF